ncbi:MAG: DNA repair protein RecO [Aquabacterium sp.]|uniref:DNA repair protein RecO n=1 Tax=Aquabacterium sp. TaxID=1872578 RepID=UPI003BC9D630
MSRTASRPVNEAFVLHSHDWSESSLILELFTREHGRVVAVAKGAKRPYSQLRPVLMPFQRLLVNFGAKRSEDAEVWLLRQAEWAGGAAWPGGSALLSGFYLNELLMRLMVRHDPHAELFDAYAQTLLAMGNPTLLHAALRAFELVLLRQLGHLPDLASISANGNAVNAGELYALQPDFGVLPARLGGEADSGPVVLDGHVLKSLEQAMRSKGHQVIPTVMAACMPVLGELKSLLRTHIHYHLGSQTLRTRQLMMELQHV